MATFSIDNELAVTPTTSNTTADVIRTSMAPSVVAPPFYRIPTTTLSPGHAAILEMHANSQSNAIIYVVVVLALYILGMSIVVIKYIRTERYEARLTRLFHDLVRRDRFFRLSRRRSSLPKCGLTIAANIVEDDLPLSPIVQVPEVCGPVDIESNL